MVDNQIASGNTLYAIMITLAAKGKQSWFDLSEKRYTDYIATENYINNWQCNDGKIGPNITINISVTSVIDSTVFKLTNTSIVPLNFFFAENHSDSSNNCMVVIPPGKSQTYIASALGFDENMSKTRLNVSNENALPGSYLIEWI
jgi:hypothetical protein